METKFIPAPGTGYMFFKHAQPDNHSENSKTKHEVSVWQGHMTLPGDERVQIRAKHSTRKGHYEITFHQFDTWSKVAEVVVPELGDMPYSDSKVKINNRLYDLRLIRSDEGHFLVRLPQVMNAKRAIKYMR